LKKVVITPSRYEEDYSGVAKSVTVIDEGAIRRRTPGAFRIIDGQTGVDVKDLLGNGKTAQVDKEVSGEWRRRTSLS